MDGALVFTHICVDSSQAVLDLASSPGPFQEGEGPGDEAILDRAPQTLQFLIAAEL